MAESDTSAAKRKRKPNWTKEQLLFLSQLVDERKAVIKGKFGVGISTKTKKEAWQSICMQVNAAFPLLTRTEEECEKRWYCLQSQARIEIADFKRQTTATGTTYFFHITQCINPYKEQHVL